MSLSGPRRWGALLVAGALVAVVGCGGRPSRGAGKRVIVLGIDGMDPQFLERHWEALPNLNRLRRSGSYARLATTIPPQSPVAWSTFMTGMDPGGHGIFDFVHRDPATRMPLSSMAEILPPRRMLQLGPYEIPLSRGEVKRFRRGKPFWQLLDEHGIPVTILRMPNNFPPVECRGRTLAGMGVPDLRGTFGTFTFFTTRPGESTRDVAGGQIVAVAMRDHRVELAVSGPVNTLRRDRRKAVVTVAVDVDPEAPVALFRVQGQEFVLRQGEWSDWVRVRFALVRGVAEVAGMFRIYAKRLKPYVEVYISPLNLDPEDPALPISTPPSYSRELARAVGPFFTQGMAEDTAALRRGIFTLEEYLQQSRLVSLEHLRLLRFELSRFQDGLLFFHFFGVDQDSHILWGEHEHRLLETYRMADAALGEVLQKAPDATVIVMSDHGFARFDRAVHLNTWLWKEGFLHLDDPSKASDQEGFPHVDWSRTRAYALGLNAVYLNLTGRETGGIVAPGSEAENLLREIRRRLLAWRDPATGAHAAEAVYLGRDVYRGAAAHEAPDLIVGWAPGYRASWQTALGAVPGIVAEDNRDEWRGDHCIAAERVPGVLIVNRPLRQAAPRLADLTVTLLREFGVPPPSPMRGRPLFGD
ncbi:MAG: alkaline phosphatase family protein [Bryobacterales bacterium]|nr:alkaline phosphatase family protein [Bryobacteraceae bacterium]MDW8355805.1 alkaline phosphatase family protein [Bryobacterales bacterium]